MKTIVVSDAHLDATSKGRENTASFVRFLRGLDTSQVNRLIVLGDLFDFWFEYKHVVFSGYFEVLRAFADLRDQGVALHFVCGNHDFWAGRFLRDELHFTIHTGEARLDFGERRGLLVHGDGLNPKDWGYRIYKWIARARPIIWLFGVLHPDWAMGIARCISRTSRALTRTETRGEGSESKALRAFAVRMLAEGEADVVLTGHSHCPLREEHPTRNGSGLYVNTGDWLKHRSYVEWDEADFRFVHEETSPEAQ
ncbi:MAG TPA: UDP-2,3-diacylglucosamine diphosphatase [Candidatus Hydrogenedentes bacterium]|nr:UDP-2,3-diacylglucosamine diphosphatase [Candidatus Hydrogenedentota bacterium]HIJ74108.1 UDP-2,3-diacylglucosamine diphosphatase [Candidatus Hydrogenedentota bacterium]